jgi:DNA helicase-4
MMDNLVNNKVLILALLMLIMFVLIMMLMISIVIWIDTRRKNREFGEKLAIEREEARQRLYDFFKSRLDSITSATTKFAKHLDLKTGYFTNYQLTVWKNQQTNLFNEIKGKPYVSIQLPTKEVESIKTFIDYFEHAEKLRNDFNKLFVNGELKNYSAFFDNIEEKKLDEQQRTAIVTDEDNNHVIAGAGTGKTTTIVGKVNYIIDRYKIAPEEILLISFTNNSTKDLADRIKIEGVEAKTFHKFGIDIIDDVEPEKPGLFDENQFIQLLKKWFAELIRNPDYLQKVTEYFRDFLKSPKSQFEFENQGDYIQYIKDHNFRTYKLKSVWIEERTTYRREVVKSIQECKIANFLLFNGVEYEYVVIFFKNRKKVYPLDTAVDYLHIF